MKVVSACKGSTQTLYIDLHQANIACDAESRQLHIKQDTDHSATAHHS